MEPKILYRASTAISPRIDEKKAIKETIHTVTIDEKEGWSGRVVTEKRTAQWHKYFDTREEAKGWLISEVQKMVEQRERALFNALSQLEKAKEL